MSNSSNTERVLRVGIFFDGTANNLLNSQLGQALEAQGQSIDLTSSYGGVATNIAKLHALYPSQLAFDANGPGQTSIYVSGIGTTTGEADTRFPGQSYGRGRTGVLGKAEEAQALLEQCVKHFLRNQPPHTLGRLQLDIFGFSRGAAAARHFANAVNATRFDTLFELAPGFTCEICFIGLFDTVAAVGGLADLGDISDELNTGLNLYLGPDCAQQVVQLSARDEHRRNYALNRIAPQWPLDIAVPGAHADVGGGYPRQMQEQVWLTRWETNRLSPSTSLQLSRAFKITEAQLPEWQARELLDPHDPNAVLEVRTASENVGSRQDPTKRVQAAIYMQRRVYGHLSRIYLAIMHRMATECGVPFIGLEHSEGVQLPKELQPVAAKLSAQVVNGAIELTDDEERLLRQRYIHQSAHWNPAIGKGLGVVDKVFFNIPQAGGRRVYDQQPPRYA